jgi:glycosyltransferase involved in cell wall biosynthesis
MSSLQGADGTGETAAVTAPGQESRGRTDEVTRSLSILRVAADLYPDVTGGFPIHAHAMSKRQAEQGHDVTVLTSNHGDDHETSAARTPYSVVRHRQVARPFGNSITPGVARSLRTRLADVDVIHAHSHLCFSTNVAAAIARVSDVPLVVTNHGLVSQTAPGWLQKLFIPTVGRFTFNAADRVLCYTETDRDRLAERDVAPPIEVVKNGVNCELFSPNGTTENEQLLFVGRLTDGKGLPTLIDTFDRLSRQYPELTLKIVGDGPGRERYEKRCRRMGIDDRVTFAGNLPNHAMPREYCESLVSVLPSHNEGLPRTVLEAMACETPVVTTALPQLEPVVDGAGYTVERGSTSGFVDAIGRLLDDEAKRRAFGEAGREHVLAENAWSRTVAETTAILQEVVEASD